MLAEARRLRSANASFVPGTISPLPMPLLLTAPARYSLVRASLLLLVLGTGCSHDVFHSPAGSGYRIGLTVAPTGAMLVLSLVGLLGYLGWRRGRPKAGR